MIEELFNQLTQKQKLVACGYFVLGMQWIDIAEDLNISKQRVEQIKNDIYKKLEFDSTQTNNSELSKKQGCIRVLSAGPPPTLILCDLAGKKIEEIKPYTRVKILKEDTPEITWKEKKQKFYNKLKQRQKDTIAYGKYTSLR